MICAGIDYGICSPCICIMKHPSFEGCTFHYLTETPKYTGRFENIIGHEFIKPNSQIERYLKISEWAIDKVMDCDQILMEGYSLGSRSGLLFNLAENGALLKLKFFQNKKSWTTIPPTSLKKYASGKGNSDKLKMYDAFLAETSMDLKKLFNYGGKSIGNPISDIVDSFYLAKYLFDNNPE